MATNPNPGQQSVKRERIDWARVFGRAALSVLLGLLLAVVIPTRFTEEMGAQTMARYAAPFSGYLFDVERRKAVAKDPDGWNEKDITVLVIDHEVLHARGEGWPARYSFYSWLLSYLDLYRPKGLFIDVILSQSSNKECGDCNKAGLPSGLEKTTACRCVSDINGFSDFRQALIRLTSNGVPVFLAAQREGDNKLVTNAALDGDERLKAVQRVGVEFSAHSVDRLAWTYPLVYPATEHDAGEPKASKDDCSRSAAFAIYKEVYKGELNVPCVGADPMSITWPLDTATDGLLWPVSGDEESEARGRTPSFLRVDLGDEDQKMYCTSSDNQLTLLGRAEARAFVRLTSRPLCVHYRTIHASRLGLMRSGELSEAFSKHFVMIGTSFPYSNDLILSPLQDRIPGVFLHAVALDNLLSRGDKIENIAAWELDWNTRAARWRRLLGLGAIGFCLIFFIVLLKKVARKRFAHLYRERTHWKKRFHRHWWAAKGRTAAFNVALLCISGFALVVFGVAMILIGNSMQIPFLLVSHVLACTIAVEWLEWSEHLFNWITDSKEDRS